MGRFRNRETLTPEMAARVRQLAENTDSDEAPVSQQPVDREMVYPPLPNRTNASSKTPGKKKSKPARGRTSSTDIVPMNTVSGNELQDIVEARLTLARAEMVGHLAAAANRYGMPPEGAPGYSPVTHPGVENADPTRVVDSQPPIGKQKGHESRPISWMTRTTAGIAALAVGWATGSVLMDQACKSGNWWLSGGCMVTGRAPFVRDTAEFIYGIPNLLPWNQHQSESAKNNNSGTPDNSNNAGDSSASPQPSASETVEAPKGSPESYAFEQVFKDSKIPLGTLTTTVADGKAKVKFGNALATMHMSDQRTINLVARPKITDEQVERNGQKVTEQTTSSPFIITKDGTGMINIEFDRSKLVVTTEFLDAGDYRIEDPTASSGYKVTRTSPTTGTFIVEFLSKRINESSDDANKVNMYALPSKEGQYTPKNIAELFYQKAMIDSVKTAMTDKCTNQANDAPLQASALLGNQIDILIQKALANTAPAGTNVRLTAKGNYSFDPSMMLDQSAKYGIGSGGDAKVAADNLNIARSDNGKSFTVSGNMKCGIRV